MPYKGINTYVKEMKNELITSINKYSNLGVPITVIQVVLETALKDVNTGVMIELAKEKEQYEKQLKSEEGQNDNN